MENELREAFASLSSQLADIAHDAREASARSRETSSAVAQLGVRVERIEASVFGSQPPSAPGAKPLMHRVSYGEGEVAELTGRLIAMQSELDEVKQQNATQLELLAAIRKSVGGVLTHPLVRRIGLVLGTVILLWLSAMQAKLQGVLP